MNLYRTDAPDPEPLREVPALSRIERRVLGVLVEKALTTPEYYPLTLKALVTGCNQRNNRDPITGYREEEVEDALAELEKRRLVRSVIADTGRAMRYRQELGKCFELSAAELAVVAELLLRGAQAEGDLRSRASRMKNLADQAALRTVLAGLAERPLPLVSRLSPGHVQRGVRWTHRLLSERELEQVRAEEPQDAEGLEAPIAGEARIAPPSASNRTDDWTARLTALEARVEELERRLENLPGS